MKDRVKQPPEISIPCICIDDRNRPAEIPISKWIVKDRAYTIKGFIIHNVQGGIVGVLLWEINLDGCFPFETYAINRFGIIKPEYQEEANNAIKNLMEESLVEMEELNEP